jgi:hypothetical protein
MRIVELIIDEKEDLAGVEAISVVEFPAIEENFIALNQQLQLAKVDDEKRILMGAALVPNKNIYRRNGDDEYYIFFSKDTVRKASELFLMNSNQNNATLEHESKLQDLSVVESWIVEDEEMDKSKKYGLNATVGTWMVSMKVNNDTIWNDFVKTGKVKGFSIEGMFADKLEMSLNNNNNIEEQVMIEKIKSVIQKNELKTQKVELGLIDDAKALSNEYYTKTDSLNSNLTSLYKEVRNALDKIDALEGLVSKMPKVSDDINKMAKELGIEVSNIQELKSMQLAMKEIKEYSSLKAKLKTL